MRTEEGYRNTEPDLIHSHHLALPGQPVRHERFALLNERAEFEMDYPEIQAHLDDMLDRALKTGEFVDLMSHAQAFLTATPTRDLGKNSADLLSGLRQMSWSDPEPGIPGPFESAGLAIVSVDESLLTRLRLPSVLLRIAHDTRLASGDASHLRSDEENMMFPSSHGLYEGIYLQGPYIGPLRGSMSPSVWCLAAPRTFGTLILMLGRGIAGTSPRATEPLQTIMIKRPSGSYKPPDQDIQDQVAAVDWWAQALNQLFGILSDPAVFRDRTGLYQPARQLGCLLTIEQLFSRVTSLLVQHRDVTTRQALLFTCLDTLEGLTGRNLVTQCNPTQPVKCLDRIRSGMSPSAQRVLLPAAERAAKALEEVPAGFALAKADGKDHLEWADKSSSFEQATAYYLVALRNATHGHGGDRGTVDQRERDTTLLIQHNGQIPDDLPALAYLYLLDLLANPGRLRTILSRPPR